MAFFKQTAESEGKQRRKKLFPMVSAAVEAVGSSRLETLAILTDVDQVTTLLSSLDDLRQGRVVKWDDAFGDL